jgi:hypothetical protein
MRFESSPAWSMSRSDETRIGQLEHKSVESNGERVNRGDVDLSERNFIIVDPNTSITTNIMNTTNQQIQEIDQSMMLSPGRTDVTYNESRRGHIGLPSEALHRVRPLGQIDILSL